MNATRRIVRSIVGGLEPGSPNIRNVPFAWVEKLGAVFVVAPMTACSVSSPSPSSTDPSATQPHSGRLSTARHNHGRLALAALGQRFSIEARLVVMFLHPFC